MKNISEFVNKIICGDCLEVMKEIPDNSIDLVVTSPPYNIGIDYDSCNDSLLWHKYYRQCEKWMEQLYKVLKDDGRFVLNHYLSLGTSEKRSAPLMELNHRACDLGFKHHSVALWMDYTICAPTAWGSWMSASAPYINSPIEGILILYKNSWKKHEKGISDISKNDFINLTHGKWNIKTETKGLTKANFSIDLANKCIQLLSYKNDIILDPFMGSGTTAVSCIKNDRRYIGIEISQNYCNIAEERIKKLEPEIESKKNLSKWIM